MTFIIKPNNFPVLNNSPSLFFKNNRSQSQLFPQIDIKPKKYANYQSLNFSREFKNYRKKEKIEKTSLFELENEILQPQYQHQKNMNKKTKILSDISEFKSKSLVEI